MLSSMALKGPYLKSMANQMTFPALLKEVKKLKFTELRTDAEKELEFVVKVSQLPVVSSTLENFFGPALKPTGQAPSKEVETLSAPYGGVWDNQTLYYFKDGNASFFAMYWPWGDKTSVTVKIFENPA